MTRYLNGVSVLGCVGIGIFPGISSNGVMCSMVLDVVRKRLMFEKDIIEYCQVASICSKIELLTEQD